MAAHAACAGRPGEVLAAQEGGTARWRALDGGVQRLRVLGRRCLQPPGCRRITLPAWPALSCPADEQPAAAEREQRAAALGTGGW